ncbi:protease complex subunit PrcB family protein [Vallitalea guaymasensis]|uniref:Protease complex subunit PrcB family protein n=1 Tax=Vallitalea guaymasensis TaxID=1185412 RepID=A0A8J8MA72_9FIRM|nr:protease complex subunit PrcB family protein [Vallitalea guaymasensis]QUH29053.1 protease complex subunit PrcB family protein [Vallitalea guaymasensis]
MKKIIFILCLLIVFAFTACGNKAEEQEDEDKIRDLEFTVVEDKDVPDVIKQKIEESKMEPFKFSFSDGQYLYIVVGYGEQPTGGYSIQVKEVYESKDYVVILTELLGPSKDDTVTMSLSYPYVVVKTEDLSLPVYYK